MTQLIIILVLLLCIAVSARFFFIRGIRKGLSSSASEINLAKTHGLFKKGTHWKVIKAYKRDSEKNTHYMLRKVGDRAFGPIFVETHEILGTYGKQIDLLEGFVYEAVISKVNCYERPFVKESIVFEKV